MAFGKDIWKEERKGKSQCSMYQTTHFCEEMDMKDHSAFIGLSHTWLASSFLSTCLEGRVGRGKEWKREAEENQSSRMTFSLELC